MSFVFCSSKVYHSAGSRVARKLKIADGDWRFEKIIVHDEFKKVSFKSVNSAAFNVQSARDTSASYFVNEAS
jgi:hypothetical protein